MQPPAADGGMQPPTDENGAINMLIELLSASRDPRNVELARRLMSYLGQTELSARSIQSVLDTLSSEYDCQGADLRYCLATCQWVESRCGICSVDQDCRKAMRDVCAIRACR
jgi:hypothetical protein